MDRVAQRGDDDAHAGNHKIVIWLKVSGGYRASQEPDFDSRDCREEEQRAQAELWSASHARRASWRLNTTASRTPQADRSINCEANSHAYQGNDQKQKYQREKGHKQEKQQVAKREHNCNSGGHTKKPHDRELKAGASHRGILAGTPDQPGCRIVVYSVVARMADHTWSFAVSIGAVSAQGLMPMEQPMNRATNHPDDFAVEAFVFRKPNPKPVSSLLGHCAIVLRPPSTEEGRGDGWKWEQ